jgi:hypothetical protein
LLSACSYLVVLLGLLFNPENGDDMFLQNVGAIQTQASGLFIVTAVKT